MNDPVYTEDSLPETDEGRVETLTVSDASAGERLDRFLSEACDLTRAAAVRLIESGSVVLESGAGKGRRAVTPDKNTKLKAGDTITVTHPEPEEYNVTPEDIPLDVVYEDADIIVVNKPTGMVVHPAPGNYTGTLVNALLYRCGDSLSGVGGVKRPGIVHRIDKDTSGLLVVAKNDEAHLALSAQLKTHTVSRVYHAVCVGNVKEDEGTLTYPIGRNPTDRKKMAAFPVGTPTGDSGGAIRAAVTHYSVLERFPTGSKWGQPFTYVKCELETGRTHQIRVHMAHIGCPLTGDFLYGTEDKSLISRTALHSSAVDITHPITGERLHFELPLPEDMKRLL